MKKIRQIPSLRNWNVLTALLATFVLTAVPSALVAKEYVLEKHRISWTGSMPAATHEGLLSPKTAKIAIDEKGQIKTLMVELDMQSIDVTDLEGSSRKKLINHLRSEDFFHVEKYPTAGFTLTSHEGDKMQGTLTIRGVSKPFTLPVKVTGHPDRGWVLTGEFSFNRQDFNVNYQNSGFFGVAKDKLISDEVKVGVSLTVKAAD